MQKPNVYAGDTLPNCIRCQSDRCTLARQGETGAISQRKAQISRVDTEIAANHGEVFAELDDLETDRRHRRRDLVERHPALAQFARSLREIDLA